MKSRVLFIGGLVLVLLIVYFGAQAKGASLSHPEDFLDNYGLTVKPSVVELHHFREGDVLGEYLIEEDRILIERGLTPDWTAHVALHEWLHTVSMQQWPKEWDCFGPVFDYDNPVCLDGMWFVEVEEGLVEAVAIDLFPNYWRWLTGRRLTNKTLRQEHKFTDSSYSIEIDMWREISAAYTNQPVDSRRAQEWRRKMLLQHHLVRERAIVQWMWGLV